MTGGDAAEGLEVVRVALEDGLARGDGLAIALNGGFRLAKIGVEGVAFDVADLAVAFGEFALEREVAVGFGGEAIEVLGAGAGDEGTGVGGSLEILDGIVDFEEEAGGEGTDVLETAVGEEFLVAGLVPLEGGRGEADDEGKDTEAHGGEGDPVAAHELAVAVGPGILVGLDGEVAEVALEVEGEGLDGGVTALGLLAKGHHENVVEVAFEADAELGGRGGAFLADLLDRLFLLTFGGAAGFGRGFAASSGDGGAGLAGNFFADDADHLEGVAALDAIRAITCEQFIQDDAEGVDVAGGSDGLAFGLLWAGVGGGHEHLAGSGRIGEGEAHVVAEDLGDAEVEELDGAVGGDEHVAGLEVAVNDQVAMHVLDGGAELTEELDAVWDVELVAVAVHVDGCAFDVVHDEVRLSGVGGAAVHEAGDVGVFEGRENLALVPEAAEDGVGGEAAEDLEGDAFLVLVVGAGGEEDGPHAAAAYLADDLVGAAVHAFVVAGAVCAGWRRGGAGIGSRRRRLGWRAV